MKIEIAAFRLLAAAFLAFGFAIGGTMLTAAPASAQEAPEDSPWYMPPAWVHPPQTGPMVRKLPGYYGHNLRYRSYGSYGRGCYGDCGYRPGTITTGYGVVLYQPIVAYLDPRYYQVVPQQNYQAQQGYAQQQQGYAQPQQRYVPQRAAPIRPKVVSVLEAQRASLKPKFVMQNGVRIIRPAPVATY
ncbi:MAG TPA: hypothetical protein VGQ35_06625 [Dongiaceae bacterium]|jgi:hypothetical protein|nr:hypothetical protein [Dongiaceae bacterium]